MCAKMILVQHTTTKSSAEAQGLRDAFFSVVTTKGHWYSSHLIGHIWCSVSLPLYLCLYLASFSRYYCIFPKFQEVTWPQSHPSWGRLTSQNY